MNNGLINSRSALELMDLIRCRLPASPVFFRQFPVSKVPTFLKYFFALLRTNFQFVSFNDISYHFFVKKTLEYLNLLKVFVIFNFRLMSDFSWVKSPLAEWLSDIPISNRFIKWRFLTKSWSIQTNNFWNLVLQLYSVLT